MHKARTVTQGETRAQTAAAIAYRRQLMQAVGSEAATAKQALAAALREKGALSVSNAALRDSLTEQMARGVEWRAAAGETRGLGPEFHAILMVG